MSSSNSNRKGIFNHPAQGHFAGVNVIITLDPELIQELAQEVSASPKKKTEFSISLEDYQGMLGGMNSAHIDGKQITALDFMSGKSGEVDLQAFGNAPTPPFSLSRKNSQSEE